MLVESKIRATIKNNGHIKIDDMMRQALSATSDSYYKSTENIGKDGDFITAPEISQLFGEIIALWAIEQWQKIGSPSRFILLELGPGQGQLMQDFLRVAKLVPNFFDAAQLHLLEINPYFITKQKSKLTEYKQDIKWISEVSQISPIPSIIIANEFFDALPIKQYIKKENIWFESVMIVDPIDNAIKYNKIQIDSSLQAQLSSAHINAKNGAIIEISQDSLKITKALSQHLHAYGGAGLIIDYGYDLPPQARTNKQYNSTLQAMKGHKYQPIMDSLGTADLTAHVDFHSLKQAIISAIKLKPPACSSFTQKEFLFKYGIELRLQRLKNNATTQEKHILDKQVARLTSSQHMGELFKVLELVSYSN